MNILHRIMDFLADPSAHYIAGVLAGFLAWRLTLTMLRAQFYDWELGLWKGINTVAAFFTVGFGLSLFFALVVLSHALLDGYTSWYTMPQNPSLNLDVPPHLMEGRKVWP